MQERGVVFAEDCRKIVIGSDHGFVYAFDRCSRSIIDRLEMGQGGWVQAVVTAKHKLQVKPAATSQHEEYKVYSMTPRGKEAKHGVASTGKKEEKWEDICMVEKKEQTLDVNGPDISVAGIDSNKSPSWSSTIANCKAGIK